MLSEALVIFACAGNLSTQQGVSGCSNASSLYFQQNPEFKLMLDRDAQQIRYFVGPQVVDAVGPFLFAVAGGSGTIKIDKNFSFNGNIHGGTLVFRLEL
jgi:hypothetical protein